MAKTPAPLKAEDSAGEKDLIAQATPAAFVAPAPAPGVDPSTAPPAPPQPEPAAALVQVDTTIGARTYRAGTVLEGVPAAIVQAYAGSIDPHPSAVAHARGAGASVARYESED